MDVSDYELREAQAVKAIKSNISAKFKDRMMQDGFIEVYKNPLIPYYEFSTTDGVGSKVLLASLMHKYDTVGIDLVAMNANDAAVYGQVFPSLFMNYLACQAEIEGEIAGQIISGIIKGLEECDITAIIPNAPRINLGKGETASLPDLVSGPRAGYSFDISGSMTGYIKELKEVKPQSGQIIIGFRSSGPHSNGYTALRTKLLRADMEERAEFQQQYQGKFLLSDKPFPNDEKTLGEILLTPTKIYLKAMVAITKELPHIFGVNITGYGLHNFNRYGAGIRYVINQPFTPQPIFKLMQEESGYGTKKMYTKFNMGLGFALICNQEEEGRILEIAQEQGIAAKVIGRIEAAEEVCTLLIKDNETILFRGY